MANDYIYKNSDDTIRVKLYKRDTGKWDADVWFRDGRDNIAFGADMAEVFAVKRDAKSEIEITYGALISINPETVTEGWS